MSASQRLRQLAGLRNDVARAERKWIIYRYLTTLRCITASNGREIYQYSRDFYKICESCYKNVPTDIQGKYQPLFRHHLIRKEPADRDAKCAGCHRVLIALRHAEDCPQCRTVLPRLNRHYMEYLDSGWGIPVAAN